MSHPVHDSPTAVHGRAHFIYEARAVSSSPPRTRSPNRIALLPVLLPTLGASDRGGTGAKIPPHPHHVGFTHVPMKPWHNPRTQPEAWVWGGLV